MAELISQINSEPQDVKVKSLQAEFEEPRFGTTSSKTQKMEPNWFSSSAYKEKVGIYSRFSDVFLVFLENSFNLLLRVYGLTVENPHQNLKRSKDLISASKRLLLSSFTQIEEVISVYDLTKTVLLQDVTGLNYKLISRLTTVVGELEEFMVQRKSSFAEHLEPGLLKAPQTLSNWLSVYKFLFSRFVEEINFNLRLFDPKSNITHKLRNSLKFAKILRLLFEEIASIFIKNSGADLLTLIANYKIQEVNDINNINERIRLEKIKKTSPLSVFQEFQFVLKPQNLSFVSNPRDVDFICAAATEFKKLSIARFSELSGKEHIRKNLQIEQNDYFKPLCQYKYIHYFKPFSKFLILFDISAISENINNSNGNYRKIPLNIPFDLAYESRSLITPAGEIYLCGGKLSERGIFTPDSSFHVLDYEKLTLLELPKMPVAKKLHGLGYLNRWLFVVGGRSKERKCSGECERFDVSGKSWKKIANLNEPVIYPSVCAFGEKYLFKFGGINQYDFLDKTIERYDISSNSWWIVRYSEVDQETNFTLLYQSLALQISDRQILIFGGRNMNGFKTDSMLVFEVNDEESSLSKTRLFGNVETGFDVPKNILDFAGDWQENTQMVFNNSVYFLRKDYFG